MLRKLLPLTAGALTVASTGFAQIDYTTPASIEIVVTAAEVQAFTGQTEKVDFRALGLDSSGRLYSYTANKSSGSDADVTGLQLLRIDVSGPTPTFQTLATHAQLEAAFDTGDPAPANAFALNAIEVASNGIIYCGQFGGTDDIIAIDPGINPPTTTTITKLREADGTASVVLSNDESFLFVNQINNFGGISNDFISIPASTTGPWPETVIASQGDVTGVTGAPEAGFVSSVQLSNGNFLLWDELFRQGSDQIIRVIPGAPPTVEVAVALADVGPLATGEGFEGMAIDSLDTVFAWNEFPNSTNAPSEAMFIYPSPISGTTRITLTDAAINTATGLAANRDTSIGGIKVYEPNANTRIVYIADEAANSAPNNVDNIIAITYIAPVVSVNGDADGNGVVDVADVTAVHNFLNSISPAPSGDADFDNDTDVDLTDANLIADFIIN